MLQSEEPSSVHEVILIIVQTVKKFNISYHYIIFTYSLTHSLYGAGHYLKS